MLMEQPEFGQLGDSGASISGEVATAFGDMVEGVEVSLNLNVSDVTSLDGKFAFENNVMNSDYAISSSKGGDFMNGISTLDLVLIQQHVLGLGILDSPYKVIAADINSDGSVSTSDLVDLRRLILGLTTEFPRNTSWRFVDKAQTFDNDLSPFPFTEVLKINNFDHSMLNQDFVGVKIGDVSGNAIANSAFSENRSTGKLLTLSITDVAVKKGEFVEVEIHSDEFTDILGFQFTMDLTGLEFISVSSGAIQTR